MSVIEHLAKEFHDAYERLAPEYGYKTREASAVPWADVPEQNKALMMATVEHVMAGAVCLTDAERERVLWWLHRPVPPGPMKDLDVAIIAKLTATGGQ